MSTHLLARIGRASLALLATFCLTPFAQAESLTVESLYEKFNLRTIRGSHGPLLKSLCHRYPKDLFPADGLTRTSKSVLTMRRGASVMTFQLLAGHDVRIRQTITDASYRSTSTYKLQFDADAQEWRAGDIIIPMPKGCVVDAPQRNKRSANNKPWAVRANPVTTLNHWPNDQREVERFAVLDAVGWGEELILRSQQFINAPLACDVTKPATCPSAPFNVSAVNLSTGAIRHVHSDRSVRHGYEKSRARQRKISNGHLIERFGHSYGKSTSGPGIRLMVTDLTTGNQVKSGPLQMSIDDVAIHGKQLVVTHYESFRRYKKKGGSRYTTGRSYSASRFDLATLGLISEDWVGYKTLLTDDALYSYSVPQGSNGFEASLYRIQPDGKKQVVIKGVWPFSPANCGKFDRRTLTNSGRFLLLIDSCGIVRGFDLAERKTFYLKYMNEKLFKSPSYTSTENLLIVSSSQEATVRALDLRTSKWIGNLPVDAVRVIGVSGGGTRGAAIDSVFVIAQSNSCENPYPYEGSAVVPRQAYQIQRLDFLQGNNGKKPSGDSAPLLTKFSAPIPAGEAQRRVLERVVAKQRKKLNPYRRGSKTELLERAVGQIQLATVRYRTDLGDEQNSYGSLNVRGFCQYVTAPVHRMRGETPVGEMHLLIRPQSASGAVDAYGWFIDQTGKQIGKPALVWRYDADAENAEMLVFADPGNGWINLSPDRENPVWVRRRDLPVGLLQGYKALNRQLPQN